MKYSIRINKTAHYYMLGNNENVKTIWFVLHGYGYSAEHFIKKFEPVLTDATLIVAPEGLSKFYLNGVTGRVGASWMTKENREDEIIDYINYLNQLYKTIVKNNDNVKINVVGFSQGAATASRWLADGKVSCTNLILWSSFFPDDVQLKNISNTIHIFILYGDEDEYIKDEWVEKQKNIMDASARDYQLIKFKGKHDVPAAILLAQTLVNNWH